MQKRRQRKQRVRYAVVGLGHIAQVAVLPAFRHARANSELALLASDDPAKRRALGRRYGVPTVGYDEYGEWLERGDVDAVYLAVPNHLHRPFAVRAARAGVHVLCEKPMAPTEADCRAMIEAARRHRVQLMVAYRLHFEAANLRAVALAARGELGTLRCFDSVFTMQVRAGDVRLLPRTQGGGPLYDIGVYCINAARMLFRAEPTAVSAMAVRGDDARFRRVEEGVAAILRFPGERVATFVCSFGAADVSTYRLVGTRGALRMEPAYEYVGRLGYEITVDGRRRRRTFARRDQFAPELLHFSQCVLTGRVPEPSGQEGLLDVTIVRAVHRAIATGRVQTIRASGRVRRPTLRQEIRRPPVRKPRLVKAQSAST